MGNIRVKVDVSRLTMREYILFGEFGQSENDVKHFIEKHPDRTPTHVLLNPKYKVDETIKCHGVELEVISDEMQGLKDYTIAEMRDK